jgi:hypothetical protein
MGALINRMQLDRVQQKLTEMMRSTPAVLGNLETLEVVGADKSKGAF